MDSEQFSVIRFDTDSWSLMNSLGYLWCGENEWQKPIEDWSEDDVRAMGAIMDKMTLCLSVRKFYNMCVMGQ
jgi:hypothetical protein